MKIFDPLQALLLFLSVIYLGGCRPEGLDATWQACPSGSNQDIFRLHFDSKGTGWAAGGQTWYAGVILTSNDGGQNWYPDLSDTKAILDLAEDDTGQIFATGVDGHLWVRQSSGQWTFHRHPEWRLNRAVLPLSPDEIILAGGQGFQFGFFFRADTMDQVNHITETENLINDLARVADDQIVAAGYGAVMRSMDRGRTWAFLDITGDHFMAIDMVDEEVGYLIGYGGTILQTRDGWQTWSSIRNGDALSVSNLPFRALDFIDAETGVIVGEGGLVWLTRDGGDHWQRLLGISRSIDLTAVAIHDEEIFVAGTGGNIFRTPLP